MSTLALTITPAGLAAIVNAQNTGTGPLRIVAIALCSDQAHGEIKRIDALGAAVVADDTIHVTITDESADAYSVRGLDIYATGEDGEVLFATYAQESVIIQKSPDAVALLAVDIVLTSVPPGSVTIGDAQFAYPQATTERKGVLEIATDDEVIAGSDEERAVTPAGLAALTATSERRGLVELATSAEVQAGTDAERAVTPAGLAARTATESRAGLVELATSAEVQAGTDSTRVVTPAGLAARTATESRAGLIELATSTEAQAGTDSTRAVTAAALAEIFAGMVAHFPMSSAPPGWLKANGAAVSRTTYARLFARIGTVHGAGDGVTTFNLPDLRGEFVRGLDDGRGIDAGRALGSGQADELKRHNHESGYAGNESSSRYGLGGNNLSPTRLDWDGGNPASYTHAGALTSSTGGAETRPRNVALLACIKY